MRQKATWIIPGILVTLLLGLLWAMPAFAAEAGNVDILNKKGGDEIRYVSLQGAAADTDVGFYIQVEDQDLNAPTVYSTATGGKDRFDAGDVADVDRIDWTDLADMNDDGKINVNDIKFFLNATAKDEATDVEFGQDGVSLDVTNGTLSGVNAYHLEFELNELITIGGRAETRIPSSDSDVRVDLTTSNNEVSEPTRQAPTSGPRSGDQWTWLDVLDTNSDGRLNERDGTITANEDVADTQDDESLTGTIKTSAIMATREDNPATGDDPATTNVDEGDNPATTLINEAGTFELQYSIERGEDAEPAADPPVVFSEDTVTITIHDIDGNDDNDLEDDEDVPIGSSVDITFTYQVPVLGIGNLASNGNPTNRVTISSQAPNSSVSLILTETDAVSGKFGVQVVICESGGTEPCSAGQDDKADTAAGMVDGTGTVTIPVNAAGDTITVAYSDASPSTTRRTTVTLDGNPPSLNNFFPESGFSGADDEPELSFDAVDTESGIAAFNKSKNTPNNSLMAVVALYEPGESSPFAGPVLYEREHLSDDDEIASGFSASFEVEEGGTSAQALDNDNRTQYEIRWWAMAMDEAGNLGVSDSKEPTSLSGQVAVTEGRATVTGTKTKFNSEMKVGDYIEVAGQRGRVQSIASNTLLTVESRFGETTASASATTGTCYSDLFDSDNLDNIAGCDGNVVRVDTQNPTFTDAVTGSILGDDDKPDAANSLTSIQAIFDEALDCDTVTADDFEVDGATPNDATCSGSNVYLDVDELDRDEKPEVVMVGSVSDSAGNVLDSDDDDDLRTQDARDGIGASLTISVAGSGEGDRPITDRRITVTITSDERLASNPSVEIRRVSHNYELVNLVSGTGIPTGGTNEWTFERNFTTAGLYNVYVSATNVGSANGGSAEGLSGEVLDEDTGKPVDPEEFKLSKDELEDDGIILFEVDRGVAAPTFDPDNDGSTDNPNVFIRVDFDPEGKEYAIAAKCEKEDAEDKAVSGTGTCEDGYELSTQDVDTSGLVEITKATFDGEDVLEDIITRDWVLFVYRHGNLTLGAHKLEIEAMDKAGNEAKGKDFTVEFTVTERKPYTLNINPGPNLVSLPANPVDGDVNAVFGGAGNEDIMSVVTFDNISGLWMTATRGEDGMFMGDLTTIDAMHGYWVVADGIVDVDVVLTAGGLVGITPPSIAVSKGWNLVSVIDTAQGKGEDEGVFLAKDYFANVDAQVVYGYNSLTGVLGRISAGDDSKDTVSVGSAYWVYANEAGIIIP